MDVFKWLRTRKARVNAYAINPRRKVFAKYLCLPETGAHSMGSLLFMVKDRHLHPITNASVARSVAQTGHMPIELRKDVRWWGEKQEVADRFHSYWDEGRRGKESKKRVIGLGKRGSRVFIQKIGVIHTTTPTGAVS